MKITKKDINLIIQESLKKINESSIDLSNEEYDFAKNTIKETFYVYESLSKIVQNCYNTESKILSKNLDFDKLNDVLNQLNGWITKNARKIK